MSSPACAGLFSRGTLHKNLSLPHNQFAALSRLCLDVFLFEPINKRVCTYFRRQYLVQPALVTQHRSVCVIKTRLADVKQNELFPCVKNNTAYVLQLHKNKWADIALVQF
jgi:hypothetical protein